MQEDRLNSIERKLDLILRNEKLIKHTEEAELKEEKKEEQKEEEIFKEEKKIEKSLLGRTLDKVDSQDIIKSIIGAFIGTAGHFAFFYGKEIAQTMSMMHATVLFLFSYLIGIIFIYFSGFKKVKRRFALHVLPVRVTVIFFVSILSTALILILFAQIKIGDPLSLVYKMLANVSVLAMFGAVTADFIKS
ncbi:MAG: DUF2391 family protein [Candidatus Woesearchaeota archaeon]